MKRIVKKVKAIMLNDRGEVCHRLNDVVSLSLARNETLSETKEYLIKNYKDYTVQFFVQ